MKDFMNYNFNIKSIVIACYVAPGHGDAVHKNRPSHGLAIQLTAPNKYEFETGERITVDKNEIIYLPKGSDYITASSKKGTSSCYAINFQISDDISFAPFRLKAKNTQMFIESFKRAEQAWKQQHFNCEMKCKAELYNILFLMQQEFRLGYAGQEKLKIIRPAVEYIHQQYTAELISVEKLAKICGITPTYFRQLFKKFYGTSPVKYINNLKINRAKELIKSGMYSVSEVAFMSGYSDLSHFSREFKKATDLPPSDFHLL